MPLLHSTKEIVQVFLGLGAVRFLAQTLQTFRLDLFDNRAVAVAAFLTTVLCARILLFVTCAVAFDDKQRRQVYVAPMARRSDVSTREACERAFALWAAKPANPAPTHMPTSD